MCWMIKNVFTKKFRREERRVVWGESKALALKCSMCWSMWDCMTNWINLRSHMGQELVRDRCGMIPCGLWKTITKGRMCWTSWSVKVKLIICIHELESSNNSSNFSSTSFRLLFSALEFSEILSVHRPSWFTCLISF